MKNKKLSIIHIAIADEQHVVRARICLLIDSFGGFTIDIEVSNGKDLNKQLQKAKALPDICMFDITTSGRNGYETLDEIRTKWPDMNILVLTAINNVCAIELMLRKGANGHLLKSSNPKELETALKAMSKTGNYYSQPALRALKHNTPKISDGELRFLPYCRKDLSYKEIAEMMHISLRTVHGYHDSLEKKLQIKTKAGLTEFAVSNGF